MGAAAFADAHTGGRYGPACRPGRAGARLMLFNSFEFLLGFLPLALAGWWLLAGRSAARLWFLLVASLVFYSYWDWRFTPLLVASIGLNWAAAEGFFAWRARWLPVAAIVGNLATLGLFKYLGFFESILAAATD